VPESAARSIRAVMQDGIGDALTYIGASVSKFERLINALLALSRTGQQSYRLEPLDVSAIVSGTLATFRQSIAAAGAHISVDTLPPVRGDATAIGQVFANLIDNALKYLDATRPGVIAIRAHRSGADVQFSIGDNGVGIPQTAQARLFQVFQRFHPDLAAGEGIGLAAIKRIVERHNGRVWFESKPGVGSTFYFTLPSAIAGEV
jgi:signal transduction histidine kinase